jgi:hypothetical protein
METVAAWARPARGLEAWIVGWIERTEMARTRRRLTW